MRKHLALAALAMSFFLPFSAHAADSAIDSTGLRDTARAALGDNAVSASNGDITYFIGFYIISPILGLVGLIFFLMMLYAGILWMTAGGNTDQVKKAKQIFGNGVIGVVIVTAAYTITQAVFNILTEGSISG